MKNIVSRFSVNQLLTPRQKKYLYGFFLIGCKLIAGAMVSYAFAPTNVWWLLFIGMTWWLYFLKLPVFTGHIASVKGACGTGFLLGVGFFLPLVSFTRLVAGNIAWLALVSVESLFIAVWAALSVWIGNIYYQWAELYIKRYQARVSIHVPRSVYLGYQLAHSFSVFIAAMLFVAIEFVRSIFPWNGFPWFRLSFPLVHSPYIIFSSYLGESGMSALVMSICAGVLLLVSRWSFLPSFLSVARCIGALVICGIVGLFTVVADTLNTHRVQNMARTQEHVTVAYIQGGSLFTHARHVPLAEGYWEESNTLADLVEKHHIPRPDVVMWPENSSDSDPFRDPRVWGYMNESAHSLKAPLIVGTLLHNRDDRITNSVIVWGYPQGPQQVDEINKANTIAHKRHDKHYLQPFGEYMPWRNFFVKISSKVALANHLSPGNDIGIVKVGSARFGVAICYEVAFDGFYSTALRNGANILASPTNNSTFGYSDMTYAQLEMSQFRAVEFNRQVVVPSTTGVSSFIDELGRTSGQSAIGERTFGVQTLRLHSDNTWAVYLFPWIEWLEILFCCFSLYSGWKMYHKEKILASFTVRKEYS